MAKVYDNATDLITFARSSSGTALRRVGYGDELVTNGDFASGLTSWEQDSTNFSVVGDELVYDASGSGARFGQAVNFTAGKVYQLTFDATISSTFRVQLVNQISNDNGAQIILDSVSTGANTVVFVANSSSTYLVFRRLTLINNSTLDNISVKEVIFDRATDPLVLFNHPDDIPRIEYAADGSLKGLLIEEQRTNLVPYSEDNSQWYTAASASLSDGTDGFTLGTFAATSSSRFATTDSTITMTAGQIMTASWEIDTSQTDDLSNVDIYFGKKGGTRIKRAMTISGNAVTLVALSSATSTFGSQNQFDPVQTGPTTWRISIVAENVSGVDQNVVCGFWDNDAALSRTIAVRNPQIEQGSFPTSYIPTSNGQKTRWPDIASIPVSAFGYNQSAGTVVVEFDMLSDNAGPVNLTQAAFGFHDGTSNNRLELWSASTGTLTLRDRIAPVNYDATSSGNSLEHSTKSAASYASGEASKLVVNGGTAVVAGTATTPPAYSTLLLGDTQNVDAELNGHIKSLSYFPRRLTDAQLQELTS